MVALPKYLLSADEVAEWLGVKVGTIRKWTCYDKIPVTRIGRRVGYKPYDIERWVALMNPHLDEWERKFRRVGRVVEGIRLENGTPRKGREGSNPSPAYDCV
jgi:excisionase family DNA binding protein